MNTRTHQVRQITAEEAVQAYAKLLDMDRAAFLERRAGRHGLNCHEGAEELQAIVDCVWAAGYGFDNGKLVPLQVEAA